MTGRRPFRIATWMLAAIAALGAMLAMAVLFAKTRPIVWLWALPLLLLKVFVVGYLLLRGRSIASSGRAVPQ